MLFNPILLTLSTQSVDTLSQEYDSKWKAAEQSDQLMQAAGQSDLMIVVIAVVMVIWLVLFFFLYRLDTKVSRLEQEIEDQQQESEA